MKTLSILFTSLALGMLVPQVYAASDIKDCSSRETREIAQAIDWGSNHWKEFEAVLEDAADVNIKNCLEKRFKKNGKVVCEEKIKGNCKGPKGKDVNGWASPFNKKCHICPVFLDNLNKIGKAVDRKACYFSLITHEWAHTCERTHKSIEKIDDAAFDFWKKKHPKVSIDFKDCGMD